MASGRRYPAKYISANFFRQFSKNFIMRSEDSKNCKNFQNLYRNIWNLFRNSMNDSESITKFSKSLKSDRRISINYINLVESINIFRKVFLFLHHIWERMIEVMAFLFSENLIHSLFGNDDD